MSKQESNEQPIRVVLQEPALPKYRLPVFRALAEREGIDPRLYYGDVPFLANAAPDGFEAGHIPAHRITLLGHPIEWHSPQWKYARPALADVLILNWDVHCLSLLPSLLRAKATGVATILWGHGYSKRDSELRGAPRRMVARFATALLFYNQSMAQEYVRRGFKAESVFVAQNCLDQSPIQAAKQTWLDQPESLEAFARSEGLLPGPVIIFVSRLVPDNRVDWLLEAGAHLVAHYPHLRIVVIGTGPDEPRLREVAGRLNIEPNVRFMGGIYDEQKLAPWMLSANIFCYPTNMGLSILHAFGYGLPVVTSDAPMAHGPEIEALRPGENGMLYAHGNTEHLAQTLRQLIDDRALSARLATGALETVTSRYNLQNMVDGIEAAIRFSAAQR